MAEMELLDRAFHHIMRRIIDTGQAPHYTETATDLGLSMEDGRQLYHDLVDGQYHSAWLYPDSSRSSIRSRSARGMVSSELAVVMKKTFERSKGRFR